MTTSVFSVSVGYLLTSQTKCLLCDFLIDPLRRKPLQRRIYATCVCISHSSPYCSQLLIIPSVFASWLDSFTWWQASWEPEERTSLLGAHTLTSWLFTHSYSLSLSFFSYWFSPLFYSEYFHYNEGVGDKGRQICAKPVTLNYKPNLFPDAKSSKQMNDSVPTFSVGVGGTVAYTFQWTK